MIPYKEYGSYETVTNSFIRKPLKNSMEIIIHLTYNVFGPFVNRYMYMLLYDTTELDNLAVTMFFDLLSMASPQEFQSLLSCLIKLKKKHILYL